MTKAKYALHELKRLVGEEKYWFPAKSRSIYAVISVFENDTTGMTEKEAVRYILDGVKGLVPADFCESVIQWNDSKCVADVYGVMIDGRPWYVKLRIEEDDLEEISFHPPERIMKLVNGQTIPAGKKSHGK